MIGLLAWTRNKTGTTRATGSGFQNASLTRLFSVFRVIPVAQLCLVFCVVCYGPLLVMFPVFSWSRGICPSSIIQLLITLYLIIVCSNFAIKHVLMFIYINPPNIHKKQEYHGMIQRTTFDCCVITCYFKLCTWYIIIFFPRSFWCLVIFSKI